jgi:hypothetical protein
MDINEGETRLERREVSGGGTLEDVSTAEKFVIERYDRYNMTSQQHLILLSFSIETYRNRAWMKLPCHLPRSPSVTSEHFQYQLSLA